MPDQANELRNLVLRAARQNAVLAGPAPRLVIVSGGKGGVGTTTLAVNLSVALSQQGSRVILVDANMQRADVATHCGVTEQYSVADVLASRRTIHEALVQGPGGVQILPGVWAPHERQEISLIAQQRLLRQIQELGRFADVVMMDVGSAATEVVSRFWQAADRVLLVTTPDLVSVMDSYATVKSIAGISENLAIDVLVNQAADEAVSLDVHRRLNQSTQRFLRLELGWAGFVPLDTRIAQAAHHAVPVILQSPTSAASRETDRIAALLIADLDRQRAASREAG